ncbi:MAG: mercury methylation corrinoid protein HgcA, partial [Chloroflexi bacterium]|nr:mercury methylation corrinoid protein HgcA [Chloroflexota bacterium]
MISIDSTAVDTIKRTASTVTGANRWDHFLARWGWKRSEHLVEPGLYALGNPTPGSPVFVTANYTLSFDALRSSLAGLDCYIMVLDTKGINVWCAAGKGTFSTAEVLNRIEKTGLADIVSHRLLILPQLSAPGVAGHRVEKRSGFAVEFGPIRASDLPEYLKTNSATPEMRRVRFGLRDRLILVPVEFVHAVPRMLVAAVLLFFADGALASSAAVASLLAGAVLFPIV